MVFYFTCSDPRYVVYMGRDKFENDKLIDNGHPEDIWFHVDKLSSAHIYLRNPPGSMDLAGIKDKELAKQKLRDLLNSVPESVIDEMCQITKQNSIDGCKASTVDIVYTPWLNLRKEERMDVGQVGFKDEQFRLLKKAVAKDKDILKKLEKTQVEKDMSAAELREEREQRDSEERARRRKFLAEQKQADKEEERRRLEEKELKSYSALQHLEGTSNANASKTGSVEEARELEEDFM